jgi:hypothetical protein
VKLQVITIRKLLTDLYMQIGTVLLAIDWEIA